MFGTEENTVNKTNIHTIKRLQPRQGNSQDIIGQGKQHNRTGKKKLRKGRVFVTAVKMWFGIPTFYAGALESVPTLFPSPDS